MRPPVMLALTWLVATVVATTVGFLATTTVGDVIRDAGPIGAEFRDDGADAERGAAPARRTFAFEQGRVHVQCTGRTARLLAVEPATGWTAADSDVGPDEDVDVELRDGAAASVRIEIYCTSDGQPRPVVAQGVAVPAGGN